MVIKGLKMLKIGFIFYSQNSYWKITGNIFKSANDMNVYPVIKCNKNGKEFKKKTIFNSNAVELIFNKGIK